jgi:hypothetical protein
MRSKAVIRNYPERERTPKRLSIIARSLARLKRMFGPRVRWIYPKSEPGDSGGATGSGDRSPLLPRVPTLSGAMALEIPNSNHQR